MAQPRILLTRIDDRFIYGQDVELWNEAVGANLVLIVNDGIAADSRKWAPMRVAAPEGVWTRFFSVQKTIDVIHSATPRQLILIMVASPADALALVKGGVPITKISIGHMQAGEGKRPVTPAVSVDDADVAALKELQERGIELEIRYLPNSNPDPSTICSTDPLGTEENGSFCPREGCARCRLSKTMPIYYVRSVIAEHVEFEKNKTAGRRLANLTKSGAWSSIPG